MAAHVRSIFEGELPNQSAVYVIADKRERRIHIAPINVNSKYTIAHEQRRYTDEGPVAAARFLNDKCNELGVLRPQDECGIYMGRSVRDLGLFELFRDSENEIRNYAMMDLNVPYSRYTPSEEHVCELIGEVAIEERAIGALEYSPCELEHLDKIGVSVNDHALDYVMFKIDQTAFLHEHDFEDGFIFFEQMLSAEWTQAKHNAITNNAIALIVLLITIPPRRDYDPTLPAGIASIVRESMTGGNKWPVTIHSHRGFN